MIHQTFIFSGRLYRATFGLMLNIITERLTILVSHWTTLNKKFLNLYQTIIVVQVLWYYTTWDYYEIKSICSKFVKDFWYHINWISLKTHLY